MRVYGRIRVHIESGKKNSLELELLFFIVTPHTVGQRRCEGRRVRANEKGWDLESNKSELDYAPPLRQRVRRFPRLRKGGKK